ncbi:hypothetical protein CC2G_002996 [Coprinopsis cinerea AmutBmut pab1-1]|nr:hypothetical protein CC2G_002996 [Coprinopsis cinerea AmutBmut pab1-1]
MEEFDEILNCGAVPVIGLMPIALMTIGVVLVSLLVFVVFALLSKGKRKVKCTGACKKPPLEAVPGSRMSVEIKLTGFDELKDEVTKLQKQVAEETEGRARDAKDSRDTIRTLEERLLKAEGRFPRSKKRLQGKDQ